MNTEKNDKHLFIWIIIFISTLCAIYVLFTRYKIEVQNNKIEIVMDNDAINEDLMPLFNDKTKLMNLLKESGITSIALNEESLLKLQKQGSLFLLDGNYANQRYMMEDPKIKEIFKTTQPGCDYIYILIPQKEMFDDLKERLVFFFTPLIINEKILSPKSGFYGFFEVKGEYEEISLKKIGFYKNEIENINSNGFKIILRPENKPQFTEVQIGEYLQNIISINPGGIVVFTGENNEVFGYPYYLNKTADILKNSDTRLGLIEIYNPKMQQKGIETLSKSIPGSCLRLQSIMPAYAENIKTNAAVSMFSLGARERNIRLFYLRPWMRSEDGLNIIDTNLAYIKGLKSELTSKGFQIGNAEPFPNFYPPKFLVYLITLAVGSAILLLLKDIIGLKILHKIIIILVPTFFYLLLDIAGKSHMAGNLIALSIGCLFPMLAYKTSQKYFIKNDNQKLPVYIKNAVLATLTTTFITLLGAIIITGVLSNTKTLLQIEGVRGIKLLMILPAVLVVLQYLFTGPHKEKFNNYLKNPILYWHAAVICLVFGFIAFNLLRSGNTSFVSVSPFERKLRSILDIYLIARPRFKEFLIGYPALMFSVYLGNKGLYRYLWVFLGISAIGQADIIDTFMHFHTPLYVSFLRTFNGLWIGCFIGLTTIAVFWFLMNRFEKIFYKTGNK